MSGRFTARSSVDDEFRTRYQRPFDTVIRAVAKALEGRYATLMGRVEEIAAMPDRAAAAAAFAREIPEAMPLQWHFFKTLTTGDWLPHLATQQLLGEPMIEPEEASNGFRNRQWPVGNYLRRLAESPDPATRKRVAETLRAVATSRHPDIHQDGIEILAALPPEESAPLVDMAVAWLGRESRFGFMQAPEILLKKLAEGKQSDAALSVARALLQLWDEGGEIASLYGRHMYEHHLPSAMKALTAACGEDALRLFMELLVQAAGISGKNQYDHYSSRPVTDDDMANHDIYAALITAVRRSAKMLIAENPARMRSVIGILTENPAKIFVRLALHVLAQNPTAAPELSDAYALNPELIEQTWARHEYGELARAWFPSLSPGNQQAVLSAVDAMPDKYRAAWRARFAENHKTSPTAENERVFSALTIRDALWEWRSVLPPGWQQALNDIVAELGDPDAWRHQLFPPEQSPRSGPEFSTRPILESVAFLRTWRPQGDQQLQTVTALAQELRTAVGNDPKTFASNADQFVGLRPIYIRRVLEGLQSVANNERDFDWGKVLKLIEFAYSQHSEVIDPATLAEGDDKDWTWACHTAVCGGSGLETIVRGARRDQGARACLLGTPPRGGGAGQPAR
jgi:hypothetical protein